MPIIPSLWTSSLMGTLSGVGMTGSRLFNFCNTVGSGSAMSVIGKSFSTVDVGTAPGAGVGMGTGIQGLSASIIKNQIYSECVSAFGQSGTRLMDFANAVSKACVEQMGKATLSSTHTPVFLGSGTITPGSIKVSASEWGSNIQSAGAGIMNGTKWASFAKALGKGQALNILSMGTGTVTISGSPAGTPSPGAGSGTGVIS